MLVLCKIIACLFLLREGLGLICWSSFLKALMIDNVFIPVKGSLLIVVVVVESFLLSVGSSVWGFCNDCSDLSWLL